MYTNLGIFISHHHYQTNPYGLIIILNSFKIVKIYNVTHLGIYNIIL